MAKQTSDIFVRLNIQEAEGLEKLKSAFRELDKTIGPTSASIDRARQGIIDYAQSSRNTEQVIKGSIEALKSLRGQVERGSDSWAQISNDLLTFEQQARRTDSEIEVLRRGIASSIQGHAQSRSSIEAHVRSLRDLASQATLSGNTLGRVQQDIARLEQQIDQTTTSARTSRQALTQALAVNPQAILNQWRAYTANLQDATLSTEQLAEAQRRLNILGGAPRIQQRRAIAAQAEITSNPEYQRRFGVEGRAYAEGLPDTTAALSQRLRELQEDLANTYRGTDAYLALQRELVIVQRDATAATQGLGAALLRDLDTGAAVRSQRNLQEVAATLRNEMSQLDTTTSQGFDQYTRYASDVSNLEQQIARLGRAYNTVATNAQQLSSTTENAVLNTMINEAAMGRIGRQQRARAEGMQELRQAITAGVQGTPLMLPAAGQTSAPGTGQARSGGARPLRALRTQIPYAPESGQVEYTFGSTPELRSRTAQAFFRRPTQEVEYGPAAAGYTPSSEAAARAAQRSGFAYRALATDIRIAQTAGSNSLTTLEAQRSAWTRLQNAVDIGSNKYRLAAKRIEELDQRMGRGGPPRLGGRQIAQIGGAAISGGIFGGLEGFLGGVIGGVVGGVGGSFAGAAAGAQVGILRQQLAGTTAYAAEIGKMQIALRGVSGSQANYNQAIQAAARLTNELNIPQREATAGITRLGAAVLGAGGTMNDATYAFRAITESIKATGGNAEQVDGALLALTQVFSKGKVSAEELNQIAERLPGTFTLFAKATGKTGPELQKALQQGTVGLNDLMKFLELARSKNAATALEISKSSEDAGARMTIAFQKMALEVGKVLQPIGAQFQDAFAGFAKQATPGLLDATQKFGGLLKVIMDNGAAIAAIAKLAVQFGIATYAIKAFTALQGPLTLALQAIAVQFGVLNQQTIAAEARLRAFATTAKTLAASLAAPIILTVAIIGVDIVLNALRDIDKAQKKILSIRSGASAPEWYKRAGGDAMTQAQATRLAGTVAAELDRANTILAPLRSQMEEVRRGRVSGKLGGRTAAQFEEEVIRAQRGMGSPLDIGFNKLALELKAAQDAVDQLTARYQYVIDRLPGAPTGTTRPPSFPTLTPTGTEGDATRAANDAQRTAESLAQQEMRLADAVFDHKQDLERKRYELSKELLDLETKNRLDQMGSIEREAAQALEQRRSRDVEYQERLRDINDQIAKAQRELLSAQRMAAVTGGAPGSRNYSNIGGLQGGRQMLHGIPGYAGYDPAHATPTNIHYHFSGKNPQETLAVATYLREQGYQISEFGGMGQRVGGHADGSQHYRNNAFDIGGASLGQTDAQIQAGLKRVHALINAFLNAATPTAGPAGAQGRRNITDVGDVGIARSALETKLLERQLITGDKARNAKAADIELANSLTSAFRSQNEELSNTLRTETLRAELQSKGYTSTQVDFELKLADALDRRNKLIAVASADTRLNDETRALAISNLNAKYQEQVDLLNKIYNINQANANSFGFREGAQRYVESIGTMRDATAQLTESGLKGLEDVLFQLTTTGTANFQEFAASILQQSARMIMQLLIQKTIMQIIGAIGGGGGGGGGGLGNFGISLPGVGYTAPAFGSANGNVFAANGIVPYAMGGIVNRPTYFPFANGGSIGTGLMGEAGPEAIIPLQRGANGKLGVAGGGGTTNIVVNVDASGGTSVSGDEAQAKQLGQVVTAAVQAELIKQRRPGGLLNR